MKFLNLIFILISEEWNKFYSKHKTTVFYKDRHWLWQIYPEIFPIPPFKLQAQELIYSKVALSQKLPKYESNFQNLKENLNKKEMRNFEVQFPPRKNQLQYVLEFGCGEGSSAFPLLEKSSQFIYFGIDISEEAIKTFQQRKRYDENVICARVSKNNKQTCELAHQQIQYFNTQYKLNNQYFNYSLITFVLSALDGIQEITDMISTSLQLSDNTLIYDYAEGDYREIKRLNQNENYKELSIGKQFTRQSEHTLASFFNDKLEQLIKQIITKHNAQNQNRQMKLYEFLFHQKEELNRKTNQQWTKRYKHNLHFHFKITERTCGEKIFPAPDADKIAMIVLGIVNCFIPGLGLCLVSLFSSLEAEKKRISNYVIALLQFLLGIFIIGWVWAIINGIIIAVKGLKKDDSEPVQSEAKIDKIKSQSQSKSAATP